MNTEQIINELEGLVKFRTCPSYIKDALALIKELQAHNENLKKENKYLRERLAEEAEIKEDLAIVRVNRSCGKSQRLKTVVHIRKAAIVFATIKEMRDKLITCIHSYRQMDQPPSFGLFHRIITETTEELLKAQREENESEKGQPHE